MKDKKRNKFEFIGSGCRFSFGVMGLKMIKNIFLIAIFYVSMLSAAIATDEGGWFDRDGNPVPDSDEMKSADGFGGWLVVTPYEGWEAEWNTPSEHVPNFKTIKEVRVGEALAILPFFINPKLDSNGFARVQCDIRIIKPDQTVSVDEANIDCFTYKLTKNPRSIWLSTLTLKYIGELEDPKGTWLVELVLRDMVRNITIPLKTSFTLIDD